MKDFIDYSGHYFITENGGIGWRRNPQDGHGGHAEEHRQEMMMIAEQVAQQKINEIVPEIQRAVYSQAYNDIVNALSFDVTSAVNIGFENAESIFRDKKTQKVVADAVMKEVKKHLSKIK